MNSKRRCASFFAILAGLKLTMLGFLLATPDPDPSWWMPMGVAALGMFYSFALGCALTEDPVDGVK